uniref:DUF1681 domain-containing protein n=1 Tax=Macrostomum lignano TaxID=282301 RepID=A0A1I8H0T9_9PLAT
LTCAHNGVQIGSADSAIAVEHRHLAAVGVAAHQLAAGQALGRLETSAGRARASAGRALEVAALQQQVGIVGRQADQPGRLPGIPDSRAGSSGLQPGRVLAWPQGHQLLCGQVARPAGQLQQAGQPGELRLGRGRRLRLRRRRGVGQGAIENGGATEQRQAGGGDLIGQAGAGQGGWRQADGAAALADQPVEFPTVAVVSRGVGIGVGVSGSVGIARQGQRQIGTLEMQQQAQVINSQLMQPVEIRVRSDRPLSHCADEGGQADRASLRQGGEQRPLRGPAGSLGRLQAKCHRQEQRVGFFWQLPACRHQLRRQKASEASAEASLPDPDEYGNSRVVAGNTQRLRSFGAGPGVVVVIFSKSDNSRLGGGLRRPFWQAGCDPDRCMAWPHDEKCEPSNSSASTKQPDQSVSRDRPRSWLSTVERCTSPARSMGSLESGRLASWHSRQVRPGCGSCATVRLGPAKIGPPGLTNKRSVGPSTSRSRLCRILRRCRSAAFIVGLFNQVAVLGQEVLLHSHHLGHQAVPPILSQLLLLTPTNLGLGGVPGRVQAARAATADFSSLVAATFAAFALTGAHCLTESIARRDFGTDSIADIKLASPMPDSTQSRNRRSPRQDSFQLHLRPMPLRAGAGVLGCLDNGTHQAEHDVAVQQFNNRLVGCGKGRQLRRPNNWQVGGWRSCPPFGHAVQRLGGGRLGQARVERIEPAVVLLAQVELAFVLALTVQQFRMRLRLRNQMLQQIFFNHFHKGYRLANARHSTFAHHIDEAAQHLFNNRPFGLIVVALGGRFTRTRSSQSPAMNWSGGTVAAASCTRCRSLRDMPTAADWWLLYCRFTFIRAKPLRFHRPAAIWADQASCLADVSQAISKPGRLQRVSPDQRLKVRNEHPAGHERSQRSPGQHVSGQTDSLSGIGQEIGTERRFLFNSVEHLAQYIEADVANNVAPGAAGVLEQAVHLQEAWQSLVNCREKVRLQLFEVVMQQVFDIAHQVQAAIPARERHSVIFAELHVQSGNLALVAGLHQQRLDQHLDKGFASCFPQVIGVHQQVVHQRLPWCPFGAGQVINGGQKAFAEQLVQTVWKMCRPCQPSSKPLDSLMVPRISEHNFLAEAQSDKLTTLRPSLSTTVAKGVLPASLSVRLGGIRALAVWQPAAQQIKIHLIQAVYVAWQPDTILQQDCAKAICHASRQFFDGGHGGARLTAGLPLVQGAPVIALERFGIAAIAVAAVARGQQTVNKMSSEEANVGGAAESAEAEQSGYESVLCVKPDVKVFRLPPRQSNRAVRAADWQLESPDWSGRLRVVANGSQLWVRLEDKTSGVLFARCPVDAHPGLAIEPVADSSRYFVLRIRDDSGRSAFVGIGFDDRSDAFDFNVAVQDHFKWLRQEEEARQAAKEMEAGPKLDLGFKEGQTIKININTRRTADSSTASGGASEALTKSPRRERQLGTWRVTYPLL